MNGGSGLVGVLILQVKSPSQALEVVLGVDKILNGKLGQSKELDEVLVAKPLNVVRVDPGIGYVLKEVLESRNVHIPGNLVSICFGDHVPV